MTTPAEYRRLYCRPTADIIEQRRRHRAHQNEETFHRTNATMAPAYTARLVGEAEPKKLTLADAMYKAAKLRAKAR
jgi:hypothetical protein